MNDRKHKSKKQIVSENNNFDLFNFYKTNNKEFGAVIVITPSQAIYNYSSVIHKYDVEDIYRCIYPGFKNFKLLNKDNYSWPVEALSYGNIIIRACVEYESIIYIPSKINFFQYQELLNLSKQIEDMKVYLNVDGMKFGLSYESNNVVITTSLESIINLLNKSNRIEFDVGKQFYNENEILLDSKGVLKK